MNNAFLLRFCRNPQKSSYLANFKAHLRSFNFQTCQFAGLTSQLPVRRSSEQIRWDTLPLQSQINCTKTVKYSWKLFEQSLQCRLQTSRTRWWNICLTSIGITKQRQSVSTFVITWSLCTAQWRGHALLNVTEHVQEWSSLHNITQQFVKQCL